MTRVNVQLGNTDGDEPWKTSPVESCQTSTAASGNVPPPPDRSTSLVTSNFPSPTSAYVRMSFSLDPRIARVTFPSTAETLIRLARPTAMVPSPTFVGLMTFPGPGPSLVWRLHTCTNPLSHKKAIVSFVEEKEACKGTRVEGRTSLNDDIGGGTFWERKGVRSALTLRMKRSQRIRGVF